MPAPLDARLSDHGEYRTSKARPDADPFRHNARKLPYGNGEAVYVGIHCLLIDLAEPFGEALLLFDGIGKWCVQW